jgi:hypothetical protein
MFMRLGVFQSQTEPYGAGKKNLPVPGNEKESSDVQLVT